MPHASRASAALKHAVQRLQPCELHHRSIGGTLPRGREKLPAWVARQLEGRASPGAAGQPRCSRAHQAAARTSKRAARRALPPTRGTAARAARPRLQPLPRQLRCWAAPCKTQRAPERKVSSTRCGGCVTKARRWLCAARGSATPARRLVRTSRHPPTPRAVPAPARRAAGGLSVCVGSGCVCSRSVRAPANDGLPVVAKRSPMSGRHCSMSCGSEHRLPSAPRGHAERGASERARACHAVHVCAPAAATRCRPPRREPAPHHRPRRSQTTVAAALPAAAAAGAAALPPLALCHPPRCPARSGGAGHLQRTLVNATLHACPRTSHLPSASCASSAATTSASRDRGGSSCTLRHLPQRRSA